MLKNIVKLTKNRKRYLVTIPKQIAEHVNLDKYSYLVVKTVGKDYIAMRGFKDEKDLK